MIHQVFNPMDPQATVNNAQHLAKGVAQLAGHALGLSGADMTSLEQNGIPGWVYVVVGAVAGAVVFSRYAPEHWVAGVRSYGR